MKRQRGRNRNNKSNHNNSNRSLDSNGPDGKVRGNASTIYEKYTSLARDAAASGNRVKAENLRQHAEHYLRLVNVQEAAKAAAQAAREEADAARAARGDNNRNDKDGESDGNDNRRNRRYPPRVKRSRDTENSSSSDSKADNKSDETSAPDGLEVVTQEAGATSKAPAVESAPTKSRRKAPTRLGRLALDIILANPVRAGTQQPQRVFFGSRFQPSTLS